MTDLDIMACDLLAAELGRKGWAGGLAAGVLVAQPEHVRVQGDVALATIRTALLTAPPGYVLADRVQLGVALESVRAAMDAAYHRRFPECCGSYSPDGCCGNPREAWTKEDRETMDALDNAEKALSAMLASAPEVK